MSFVQLCDRMCVDQMGALSTFCETYLGTCINVNMRSPNPIEPYDWNSIGPLQNGNETQQPASQAGGVVVHEGCALVNVHDDTMCYVGCSCEVQ